MTFRSQNSGRRAASRSCSCVTGFVFGFRPVRFVAMHGRACACDFRCPWAARPPRGIAGDSSNRTGIGARDVTNSVSEDAKALARQQAVAFEVVPIEGEDVDACVSITSQISGTSVKFVLAQSRVARHPDAHVLELRRRELAHPQRAAGDPAPHSHAVRGRRKPYGNRPRTTMPRLLSGAWL
jgi:hypothetical protein